MTVSRLLNTQSGPVLARAKQVLDTRPRIEYWFSSQWLEHAAARQASVDLCNSGFKLAPRNTNLFAGGFENLTKELPQPWIQAVMTAIELERIEAAPEQQRVPRARVAIT